MKTTGSIFMIIITAMIIYSCSPSRGLKNESDLPKLNNVLIANVGYNVNTEFDEIAPAITGNGRILYFTSSRPNPNSSKPGDEDIWYCLRKGNDWEPAINLGLPINNENKQGATSFQPDGQGIYFAMDTYNLLDVQRNFDIYNSKLLGTKWTKPENLGEVLNDKDWDSAPSISSDDRMLIFASKRKGGYGKSDLWVSIKDASGNWGKPMNLGPTINSDEDEVAPFLAHDNKTLYFASKSEPTFGEFDIFVSQYENGVWMPKKNLGSPYNSENDDLYITIPAANDTAFFASNRPGSINNSFDIWFAVPPPKIKFQPVVVAVTGIVSEFGSNPKKPIEADLIIKDLSNDSTISSFKSNSITGQYYIILTRGRNYGITAKAPGYLFYTNQFDIPADATYKELRKDIDLFPLRGKRPSVRLMVFFDFDKANLRPESNTDLQNAIDFLNANPNVEIEIAGYTDKRGSDEYNDKLSQERSNSVASYIIVHGKIDPLRVKPVGYGKRKLLYEGDTEEIHQINRRVEMVLLKY